MDVVSLSIVVIYLSYVVSEQEQGAIAAIMGGSESHGDEVEDGEEDLHFDDVTKRGHSDHHFTPPHTCSYTHPYLVVHNVVEASIPSNLSFEQTKECKIRGNGTCFPGTVLMCAQGISYYTSVLRDNFLNSFCSQERRNCRTFTAEICDDIEASA